MHPIASLRWLALTEGCSFLILLGIAMPLKYLADVPMAVTVVGWLHGLLFVLFGLALLRAWFAAAWPFLRVVFVFIAALVPFGPFVLDSRMKVYQREFEARGRSCLGQRL